MGHQADMDHLLVEHLKESPTGTILGTDLKLFLDKIEAGFDHKAQGFRRLSDYVQAKLPAIVQVGRSGGDLVYGLKENPTLLFDLDDTTSLWATWLSSDSPLKILIDIGKRELRSIPKRQRATGDQELILESPDSDFHTQVVAKFVDSQESPQKEALRAYLDEHGDDWWKGWNTRLREESIDFPNWLEFRTQKFSAELYKRIEELSSLQSKTVHSIVEKINASKGRVGRRLKKQNEVSQQRPPNEINVDLLRDIAAQAVRSMELQELRRMPVPLGVVVDALLKLNR